MRLRGGSGLGDSLYLRPIAEHYLRTGKAVTVLSHYPDVFIGTAAQVQPFEKIKTEIVAHYATARQNPATTQYQDMLDCAGIRTPVPLRMAWPVRNPALIGSLKRAAAGRPIVLVHGGRAPFGRTDGFGMEILPQVGAFREVLAALGDCLTVRIGSGDRKYELDCEVDLWDSTSVSDLLDLGASCDGIVGQCSYVIPLAELLDKPLLIVWARRGLQSASAILRSIVPKKILSKPSSRFVMDDWSTEQIQFEARTALGLQMEAAA